MKEILQTLTLAPGTLLKTFAVTALLATWSLTASADTVLTGNTFYAEDFQDSVVGMPPFSSTQEVVWDALGQGSRTVVREDPADSNNLLLKSDGADTTDGTNTGRIVKFSANMVNNLPSAGSVSFRFFFSELFHQTSFSDPSVFRVADDINGSVQNSNTAFGLKVNPSDAAPGKLTLMSNEVFTGGDFADLVLGEWITATIDYDLQSQVDNVSVSISSATIGTVTHTLSSDISGMTPDGFFVHNPGSFEGGQGNVFMLDDIVWTEAAAGTPGDVDGDGDVDGADFLQIQRTDPSAIPTWETNYGDGNSLAALSVVPEPSTCLLLLLGTAALACRRRS